MKRSNFEPTVEDVISDGVVRLYRQRTDIPFTPENTVTVDAAWRRPDEIVAAFADARKRAVKLEQSCPVAWDAKFGYVTASPRRCGTGLNVRALIHLEALNLIGDLEVVLEGLRAVRVYARGIDGDGLKGAAHLYRISSVGCLGVEDKDLVRRVARVYADLANQELTARHYLIDALPRVFEDSICRALALLQSCRLVNPWELLDLSSPLRLAAQFGLLDGFSREDALQFTREHITLEEEPPPENPDEEVKRDRRDAELAEFANRRFKNVRLSARGKRKLTLP